MTHRELTLNWNVPGVALILGKLMSLDWCSSPSAARLVQAGSLGSGLM